LSTTQIAFLANTQITGLSTAQIALLSVGQAAALSTSQIASLKISQLAALSMDQVGGMTTAQIAAFTSLQLPALATSLISVLSTDQIVALSTAQIPALKTSQIATLSTNQIQAIETRDIAALLATQVCALSTDQYNALTGDQLAALPVGSPIILDLNDDGILTQSITQGVHFDLFGSGSKIATGWVARQDGLLALDRNHDGTINDGSELFGSATRLADGSTAANGYAALAELDTNHDGIISAADSGFGDLRVWVDANADGVSQAAELRSLADLHIASLNVRTQAVTVKDNDNWIGLTSNYQTTDGATHTSADAWFVVDKSNVLSENVGRLTDAISAFADFHAMPDVPALSPLAANPAPMVATSAALAETMSVYLQSQGIAPLLAAAAPATFKPADHLQAVSQAWLASPAK
jgi:hypothetical protein